MNIRQACRVACIAALAFAGAAAAQETQDAPLKLAGTLLKARDSGAVTIGYRQSSMPFSYVSDRREPIGYSIDLCRLIVDGISEAVGRTIAMKWQIVTSESRIDAVRSGAVDLECGSTTSNLERQKLVGFSPVMFVAGTKLLVRKGSPVKSYRDLAGRKVAVTAGTTNEAALRQLSQKFKVNFELVVSPDHAASFDLLAAGKVDAFATDDVLLYGFLAERNVQPQYEVVGEFLSYDPYGIMFRRDDPQLAALVNDTFRQLAEDHELERRYNRWFLRKLPSGQSINLPMSPQLATIFQSLGGVPE